MASEKCAWCGWVSQKGVALSVGEFCSPMCRDNSAKRAERDGYGVFATKAWVVYATVNPHDDAEGYYDTKEGAERAEQTIRDRSSEKVEIREAEVVRVHGRWYEIVSPVLLRRESVRERALAKLTIEERATLGVK